MAGNQKTAKQQNNKPRVIREIKTVMAMIRIYCRDHHRGAPLCSECLELETYARKRLTACPFQENKPTCGKCLIHCYQPKMRNQIRKVMRYSGPRMILRHPILAIAHLFDEKRPEQPFPKKKHSRDGVNHQ